MQCADVFEHWMMLNVQFIRTALAKNGMWNNFEAIYNDKYEVALYPALKLSVMEDCSLHNIIIMRLSQRICTILQEQYCDSELPNV